MLSINIDVFVEKLFSYWCFLIALIQNNCNIANSQKMQYHYRIVSLQSNFYISFLKLYAYNLEKPLADSFCIATKPRNQWRREIVCIQKSVASSGFKFYPYKIISPMADSNCMPTKIENQ